MTAQGSINFEKRGNSLTLQKLVLTIFLLVSASLAEGVQDPLKPTQILAEVSNEAPRVLRRPFSLSQSTLTDSAARRRYAISFSAGGT